MAMIFALFTLAVPCFKSNDNQISCVCNYRTIVAYNPGYSRPSYTAIMFCKKYGINRIIKIVTKLYYSMSFNYLFKLIFFFM